MLPILALVDAVAGVHFLRLGQRQQRLSVVALGGVLLLCAAFLLPVWFLLDRGTT